MLTGDILITTSEQLVYNLAAKGWKVVCVSGESYSYNKMVEDTEATVASILTPPYEAVMMQLDNKFEEFKLIYSSHLALHQDVCEIIAIIIRALVNGTNICLYLTEDEASMPYSKVLLEYFKFSLGITIGIEETSPCMFDINFSPIIIEMMFIYGTMTAEEYMFALPLNIPMSQVAINKLALVKKPVNLLSFNYTEYFNDLRFAIHKCGAPLESPFTIGR